MKNILISLIVGFGLSAMAASTSVTIGAGSMVKVLDGPVKVTSFILTSTTATNTSVVVYDTPTNVTSFVQAAYTNNVSYLTNLPVVWTNYFGVVNGWTNIVSVTVANTVAASTNAFPARITAAALASASYSADPVNYYFWSGCWATNTSSGALTITVNYTK